MAQHTPEEQAGAAYAPSIEDWQVLVALGADYGQQFNQTHRDSLQAALGGAASRLRNSEVELCETTNNLIARFVISAASAVSKHEAIHFGIANVCGAIYGTNLEEPQLVAMQLGLGYDLAWHGEDYLATDNCYGGEEAHEAYQKYSVTQ